MSDKEAMILKDKYQNNPAFHALVQNMVMILKEDLLTWEEIEGATKVALKIHLDYLVKKMYEES